MQEISGHGFTCFAISKGEKNLTIKCHKDLHHVRVTYIIKACLSVPRKIKEEEMLTKDSLSFIFILCFNFAVCYDRISFQGVGRHVGVAFSSWLLSSGTQSKKNMNINFLILSTSVNFCCIYCYLKDCSKRGCQTKK